MTARKKKRERIAGAFRAAKRRLWDGRVPKRGDGYICLALVSAAHSGEIDMDAAQSATDVVMSRISPEATVGDWLRYSAVVDPEYRLVSARDLQEYKHRWLDALIEEFSTKDGT